MSHKIYEHSANYAATVIELPVKQPIDGLDNLVRVTVFGTDCLISKDSDPNEKYLFFPAGCQISHTILSKYNLFRDSLMNQDNTKKGFFELNGRVKALKLKGIVSGGFILNVTDIDLPVGTEFNELDGVEYCRKYVVRQERTEGKPKGDKQSKINNRLADLMIPNQFRFHTETAHLSRNLHMLKDSDIITVTDKWHGGSIIISKVLINKKLSLFNKLKNKIGFNIPMREYGYITSSGKPKSNLPKMIEGAWENDNQGYYTSNIWKKALENYKYALENGITMYGELVGFTDGGRYIQGKYDYGCKAYSEIYGQKTYRMVIYRITYTKSDGNFIEFTWSQMKDYCDKYGIETVPLLFHGSFGELKAKLNITDDRDVLEVIKSTYANGTRCKYCVNNVPGEGAVVRIDGKTAYKVKSDAFILHESAVMDAGIEDIEAAQ